MSQKGRPLFFAALFALGCAGSAETAQAPCDPPGQQSYREAIELMCDVDRRASIDGDDPVERATNRTEYIAERVKNPDGIEFRTIWSVKPEAEQARLLGDEAKSVGLARCALADALVASN